MLVIRPVVMTEDEYKRLKAIQDKIAEQQRIPAAKSLEAEDRFAPVEKAIADLFMAVKKRIAAREADNPRRRRYDFQCHSR